MLLENMTYPEVKDYLEHNDTLLLPVGSVEQHSPYGIIGTDFIAAEGVAKRVADDLGVVVAPTVTYGISAHHMNFKGSATLSPRTYIQVIAEICQSFASHGFSRIYVINGHGGNKGGIECAFQELKMVGTPGQFALISWYDGLKETELVAELFEGQDGSHATPSEISLTMTMRPEAFPSREIGATSVENTDHYWPMTSDEMQTAFPDGRMGAASWLATAEKGSLIMRLAVETVVEKIRALQRIPLIRMRNPG